MSLEQATRRQFVSASAGMAGAGWLWLHLPALAALASCARDAATDQAPFRVLSADAGATMRAFAARIIPSDGDLPGAEEAGAVWFVDGALQGPFSSMKDPVLAGLADLDQRARSRHAVRFAQATSEQQDGMIREVEDTPFFLAARLLTVAGVFSDPRYGGNRNHAGLTLLGVEHAPAYLPPFGWYDAELARGGV